MSVEPVDLRVDARWIVPMTTPGRTLEDYCIIVRDGRILAVAPRTTADLHYRPTRTALRPHHVLLPGLVDAHAAPRDAGLAAMIKGGTGCFAAIDHAPGALARSAAALGLRAVVGTPVGGSREALSEALDLRDEYKTHPGVGIAFAPLAAHLETDANLEQIATLVDELEAGVLIPLQQTAREVGDCVARCGLRPIERLRRLGLLTPAVNAVHMVQLNAADVECAADAGISASLCITSNLRQGNGLAPLAALARGGVPLALGSDAAAAGLPRDLWTEILLLALLTWAPGDLRPLLGPWECLRMATHGGAVALGLGEQTGTLEPGKWADLCCVELDALDEASDGDPLPQLVFRGGRDKVSDVWVAGRQLLAERRLTRQ